MLLLRVREAPFDFRSSASGFKRIAYMRDPVAVDEAPRLTERTAAARPRRPSSATRQVAGRAVPASRARAASGVTERRSSLVHAVAAQLDTAERHCTGAVRRRGAAFPRLRWTRSRHHFASGLSIVARLCLAVRCALLFAGGIEGADPCRPKGSTLMPCVIIARRIAVTLSDSACFADEA